MKITWSKAASDDLAEAIAYIERHNPIAALDQLDEIIAQVRGLADFPEIGRSGRVGGTRELVINRSPYLAVYRFVKRKQEVTILRLLHGAQQWPPVKA